MPETELERLIDDIRNNKFKGKEIQIQIASGTQGASYNNLFHKLMAAILENVTCRDNLELVSVLHNNFSVPLNIIMQYNIQKEFFDAQIKTVERFMEQIYTIALPDNIDVGTSVMTTSEQIAQIDRNYPSELNRMRQEYERALCLLYSHIDGLYERYRKKNLDAKDIPHEAMKKTLEIEPSLSNHQSFFLNSIYANFNNLYSIFVAVGKLHHAAAVSSYVEDNKHQWPELLRSKMMQGLSEAGRAYLNEVHDKASLAEATKLMGSVSLSEQPTQKIRVMKQCYPF